MRPKSFLQSPVLAVFVAAVCAGCKIRVRTPPSALFAAVQRADAARVKKLLEEGADPNRKERTGWYPLHQAVYANAEIVTLLLDHGARVDVRVSRGPNQDNEWTPLHYAAYMNKPTAAEILIARGADVNAKDIWGKRPLSYARERGNQALVKLLADKGATE